MQSTLSQVFCVWINKLLGKLFQSVWLFVKVTFSILLKLSWHWFHEMAVGKLPSDFIWKGCLLPNEKLYCESHVQSVDSLFKWHCWKHNIHLVTYLTSCPFNREKMIWLWLMVQLPLLSDGENKLSQNRSGYTVERLSAVLFPHFSSFG